MVVNCFQVFMIFGLWHHSLAGFAFALCCELLSSFYDLWSLTSQHIFVPPSSMLWIAFKFLWSLVFDIYLLIQSLRLPVVNCFQVFMIFGLWHPYRTVQRHLKVVNCFQVFMIFGLWHLNSTKATTAKDYRMSLA